MYGEINIQIKQNICKYFIKDDLDNLKSSK